MEKKTIACGYVLVLFLAVVILAAYAAPAFASVTYYDHANAGGNAVIDIAGHQPPMRVRILHYDWSSNVVGACDELTIYLKLGSSWIPVAAMVDNPSQAEWEKEVFLGLPVADNILLVRHCMLQVHKAGKTVAFAYWMHPLTASIAEPWATLLGVSSVTLPPGALLIKGEGDELQSSKYVPPGASGYAVQTDWKYYIAQATLVCPAWHYCGPIGSTSTPSTMVTDITFAATK